MSRKLAAFAALTGSLLLLCALFAPAALAWEDGMPDDTYYYDKKGEPCKTAPFFEATALCTGEDLGVGAFSEPADLSVSQDGRIWILDVGNKRVVVTDEKLEKAQTILPQDQEGRPLPFEKLTGICVRTDLQRIILTDRQTGVYLLDLNGRLIAKLPEPPEKLLPDKFVYAPLKAECDASGTLYVLSENCYMGALQYDEQGKFLGFFGNEQVDASFKTMMNRFWKNILSEEMANRTERMVPVEFVSFCLDEDGFVYTVRKGNDTASSQVKCLNATGENLLPDKPYGDRNTVLQLSDVTVNPDGFITILDGGSGRLLHYDKEGELLCAFGGKGTARGSSEDPAAIADCGDSLLLLDRKRGQITRFSPTDFGRHVQRAVQLCASGRYAEAEKHWEKAMGHDHAYAPANRGLGKAAMGREEYAEAMAYFRAAGQQKLYGTAFGALRDETIRDSFGWVMGGCLLLACGILALVYVLRRKHQTLYDLQMAPWRYPLYCALHPLTGYEDMKERHKTSPAVTAVLLLLFFSVTALSAGATGFAFQTEANTRLNLLDVLLSTVGLFGFFVLCNWAVTTVADGKGRLSETAHFTAAALLPYVLGTLLLVLFSNLLSQEEASFYLLLQVLVYGWTALCLFQAIREVHMYSVGKTVWMLFLTVLGMAVLLVLCALAYDVVTRLLEFLSSVWMELKWML